MLLARIHSVAFVGLEAYHVEVEVDSTPYDKNFTTLMIVGLPDAAVKESKDRVLTAVKNSGFKLQECYCTVNLAPGNLKKEGAFYDLPIALGLLHAGKVIPARTITQYLIVGELALSGQIRPMRGALAMAMLARQSGKKGILVPAINAIEAAAVPDIDVIPINSLQDAVNFFTDPHSITPAKTEISEQLFEHAPAHIDFADVKGQLHVKRAVEIAAAGGHNVILSGPPGSGKTMIAKAMVGILPPLSVEEALETTKIHSIAGLLPEGQNIITSRPFRSPHHTVSYAGMIGGGMMPRPGEVSLAHNGVLFLDEFPEFPRAVLEVLRQPLEDRKVCISRANGNYTYPTDFICIAAMNPCPCGNKGHPDKVCRDTDIQIERYQSKISGPLLDRMDLHIDVPPLRYHDLTNIEKAESSLDIRRRVKTARLKQHKRFGRTQSNAQMSSREIKQHCVLNEACQDLMRHAIDDMGLSGRAYDRILRVARTIADLGESAGIDKDHLMEAIAYRKASLSRR